MDGDVVRDLLHEPLEALAAMLFSELLQRADVSVSQGERLGSAGVEIILILVPPHLHHPHVVLCKKKKKRINIYLYIFKKSHEFA